MRINLAAKFDNEKKKFFSLNIMKLDNVKHVIIRRMLFLPTYIE